MQTWNTDLDSSLMTAKSQSKTRTERSKEGLRCRLSLRFREVGYFDHTLVTIHDAGFMMHDA